MSDYRDVLAEAEAALQAAEPVLEHAKRATYQAGCRCLPCRTANADYQARYRRRLAEGKPMLGSVISGHSTAQRVRSLLGEGYGGRSLARLLGLSHMSVWRHQTSCRATIRVAVKIGRFWQAQQLPFE